MLVMVWLVGFALALPLYAYPPLLPDIMRDLGLSAAEAALLMSAPSLALSFFHLVGGFSMNRIGTKKTMIIGMFTLSVFTLFSATAHNFVTEATTRLMIGVGIGLAGVGILKVIANWFPQRELSLAIGFQATGWAAGNAVGLFFPVPLEQILEAGWQGPFLAFGLVGLASTIAFFIVARERNTPESSDISSAGITSLGVSNILHVKEFWTMTIAQLGIGAATNTIFTWLPTILIDAGWNPETAALATAIVPIIGVAANLTGGVVVNWSGKRKPIIFLSGIILSLSIVSLGFLVPSSSVWFVVVVIGWFSSFFASSLFAMPLALPEVGPQRIGIFIGLMMLLSSFGGFISPIAMGLLKDWTGSYLPGFLMSAGFAATLIIPGVSGRETGPKANPT
jgi:cyanate permease